MHEYALFITSPAASGLENVSAIKGGWQTQEKRGSAYLQIADRAGEHGQLDEGSSNSVYSFRNHLHYSLGSSFVPLVVFSCAVPADKIWQAQKREELGEPH